MDFHSVFWNDPVGRTETSDSEKGRKAKCQIVIKIKEPIRIREKRLNDEITAGAELYSVSKILGHGSIASTQVYAKVNMGKGWSDELD